MLIHSMHKCKDAAALQLWPYAIRLASEVINLNPRSKDGAIPLSLFSRSSEPPRLETLHPLGCPACVLENALQQGNKIRKWENRSRIGMYLGPSPTHARSVHLILSIKTGLVSPQFHVKFDSFYEMIKWENFRPNSEWQYKARILREKPSNILDLDRDTMSRMLLNKRINYKSSSTIDQGGNRPDPISDPISENDDNDEQMVTNNHEGDKDSSNLVNHYEEEQGNPNNIGNNQSTHQRSNS